MAGRRDVLWVVSCGMARLFLCSCNGHDTYRTSGHSVHTHGTGYLGRVWHKASVLGWLPLAAPIGLSPLLILTLCGSERVLVVSTEPLDDLSCLTTPGSAVPETGYCPCR